MARSTLLQYKKGDIFTFTPKGQKQRKITVISVKSGSRKGAFVKDVAQMKGRSPKGMDILIAEDEYEGTHRFIMITKRQMLPIIRISKQR